MYAALRPYRSPQQEKKVRYNVNFADTKRSTYFDPSDCDVCETRGPAISYAFDEKAEFVDAKTDFSEAHETLKLNMDVPPIVEPERPLSPERPSLDRSRSRTIRRHHATEKANFLRKYGFAYGYDGRVDEIRRIEYPHLKGHTYLDHSGATIYPQSLIREFADDLANNCYGNPHSMSPSSLLATKRVEEVRRQVLAHFNASPDDYSVVFTQNCTAALKLVGEIFPWTQGRSRFWFLGEAHMSLLGLRRIAEAAGARSIQPMSEHEIEDVIRQNKKGSNLRKMVGQNTYDLFAYPAQCNFSGLRFPLSWPARIKAARNSKSSKTLVLLDAAAYIMTSPLSLADKDSSPDFTVMSFYKIFGFPTGLGALIVKNELMPLLRKRYFGGGTVMQVQPRALWETFRETISERFEDGTINFLSIIALGHAFKTIERLFGDFVRVRAHAATLAYFAHSRMASMFHSNGRPACIIYSDRDFSNPTNQGPVIAFNFLDPTGRTVPYPAVEKFAGEGKIHVRAGSHCNPGAVLRWLHLTKEDFARRDCEATDGTVNGKTSGVVRISIGAMTTIDDILAWLDFARSMFVR